MRNYYHGSSVNISGKYLLPRKSYVINNEKAVFATNRKYIALTFAIKWDDSIFAQGHINKKLYIRELYPNTFDMFKTSGYIYYVNSKGFHGDKRLGMTGFEFIKHGKVKILKKQYIKNVYDELKKSNLRMIKYKKN